MIFINTMNPVTIAYHFLKRVQQKYNLRKENLLTDTENKKGNQIISFLEEIVKSHNLIIETEYTLDLSEDENASEGENKNVSEDEDDNTSESEYNNASDSEDDFEDWKHLEKCKYSYEQIQKFSRKMKRLGSIY